MAFDPALADLMPSTIQWAARTGYTNEGTPTFGSNTAYQAHIDMASRHVRLESGQEVVARGTVYVNTTASLASDGRITLPSPHSPTQPQVLDVVPLYDEDGIHHVEVIIGGATFGGAR